MPDKPPSEPDPGLVHYRSGCAGIVLLFLVPAIVLFTFAAFDQSLLMDLSEQRRADWLAALTVFEVRGVNLAVLAFVGAVVWESRKVVRQILDPVAVRLEEGSLHFHPASGKPPLPLDQIASATHDEGIFKSDLRLRSRTGKAIRIRNVENAEAEALVELFKDSRDSA